MVDVEAYVGHAIGIFAGAVAAYIAIRADLAELRAQTTVAKDTADKANNNAQWAHERIDKILDK